MPLKISPPDPRDSGLLPEKSGNPTDTSAAVSASTEFGSHVLVLGVRLGSHVLVLGIELLFKQKSAEVFMNLLPWRVKLERKVHNFQSLLRWRVKHEQKSALVSRLVIAWREKHEVKSASFFYGLSVWQLKHEHVNIYSLRAMKLDDLFKNLCFPLSVFYWTFVMENWTPKYSRIKRKNKVSPEYWNHSIPSIIPVLNFLYIKYIVIQISAKMLTILWGIGVSKFIA